MIGTEGVQRKQKFLCFVRGGGNRRFFGLRYLLCVKAWESRRVIVVGRQIYSILKVVILQNYINYVTKNKYH